MIATVMDIIYPHIFLTGNSCKIDMLNIKCSKSAETSLETEEQAQLPHEELQYLNLVKHIIKNGNVREDRTGTGTLNSSGLSEAPPMQKNCKIRMFASGTETVQENTWIPLDLLTGK